MTQMPSSMPSDDRQLFQHDQSNLDLVDTLRPVTYIKTGRDWLTGAISGQRVVIPDDEYQALADERTDEIDSGPRYGEGWDGMGKHTSDMTGLDRIIFEDCYNGSGGVQRPGLNVPQISKYRRSEWIAARLQKIWPEADLHDAGVLISALRTIEATPKMIERFIAGFGKMSLDATIKYFVDLAGELDQVADMSAISETPAFQNWTAWLGCEYQAWFTRNHLIDPERDDLDSDEILEPEEDRFASVAEYRYTQIGNDLGPDLWLQRQPKWYRKMLKQAKKSRSYVDLKRMGSAVHAKQEQNRMTADQASVFWSAYKLRKLRLAQRIEKKSPHVKQLMDRVMATPDSKVRYVGFWLYDQQAGGHETGAWQHAKAITKDGWSLIKEAYFSRKQDLLAAQEGLIEGH